MSAESLDEARRFIEQAVRDFKALAEAGGFAWAPWSSVANTIRWGEALLARHAPLTMPADRSALIQRAVDGPELPGSPEARA